MLTKHEKRIVTAIYKYKSEIKKNHATQGNYFDFVFLCGGKRKLNDNRSMIAKHVGKSKRRESYYSEDLFTFLENLDLLTFEEILLEISTAVVIIVESWGSACELGAFSYVDKNLDKLLVINDRDFKYEKSFINEGPLKKIQEFNKQKQRVFFEKFTKRTDNTLVISNELSQEIQKLPPKKTFKSGSFNVDNGELFIFDISYLMWTLFDLIKMFGTININNTYELVIRIYNVNKIILKNQSGNSISDQSTVKDIIEFLLTILIRFNLILNNKNNCRVNFEYLQSCNIQLKSFTSVFFNEPFLKTREAVKMKAKIINRAKKEGYILWD